MPEEMWIIMWGTWLVDDGHIQQNVGSKDRVLHNNHNLRKDVNRKPD